MAPQESAGNDRLKALDAAIGRMEKAFGKGTVMRLREADSRIAVEVIPSGSLSLGVALGIVTKGEAGMIGRGGSWGRGARRLKASSGAVLTWRIRSRTWSA
jgi:hypothetical protein